MHKRIECLFSLIALLLCGLAAPVPALAGDDAVELYFVPASIEGKVALPKGARTSYQFPEGSSAVYTIRGYSADSDEYALRVSVSGLAVCQPSANYHYDEELDDFVNLGYEKWKDQDITVKATRDGQTRQVVFHLRNAYYLYCDQVMDDYIANEITDGMTQLEKARTLMTIVGRDFDYGNASTWQDFIWLGYGDCYSATGFIVEGCRRLGIPAGIHPQHFDGGASDHRNAIALCDGDLWVFEVYTGTKPRSTWARKLDCDYQWSYTDSTQQKVCLWRYEREFVFPEQAEVIVVPESLQGGVVTEIGYPTYDISFARDNTRTIVLPSHLETIHPYAFLLHTSLTGLSLPQTLTAIGEYAFYGCTSLGSLDIPEGVTQLKAGTFAKCGTLTLTVPASVTSIADDSFTDTDVTLWVEHGSYAEGWARSKGLKMKYTGECTLPAGLKRLEAGAFEGTGFSYVTVPDGAVAIGDNAFKGCNSLRQISIPASVTSISDSAFSGLTGLTIVAPAGSEAAKYAQRKGFTLAQP